MALEPTSERLREVLHLHTPDGPLPLLLECVLGQREAGQLPLDPGEEGVVRQCQIQHIWQVLNQFDLPGCHSVCHHGGSVNQSIVPVEQPVPSHHVWPLLSS
jgi:hypothetical protein